MWARSPRSRGPRRPWRAVHITITLAPCSTRSHHASTLAPITCSRLHRLRSVVAQPHEVSARRRQLRTSQAIGTRSTVLRSGILGNFSSYPTQASPELAHYGARWVSRTGPCSCPGHSLRLRKGRSVAGALTAFCRSFLREQREMACARWHSRLCRQSRAMLRVMRCTKVRVSSIGEFPKILRAGCEDWDDACSSARIRIPQRQPPARAAGTIGLLMTATPPPSAGLRAREVHEAAAVALQDRQSVRARGAAWLRYSDVQSWNRRYIRAPNPVGLVRIGAKPETPF